MACLLLTLHIRTPSVVVEYRSNLQQARILLNAKKYFLNLRITFYFTLPQRVGYRSNSSQNCSGVS